MLLLFLWTIVLLLKICSTELHTLSPDYSLYDWLILVYTCTCLNLQFLFHDASGVLYLWELTLALHLVHGASTASHLAHGPWGLILSMWQPPVWISPSGCSPPCEWFGLAVSGQCG